MSLFLYSILGQMWYCNENLHLFVQFLLDGFCLFPWFYNKIKKDWMSFLEGIPSNYLAISNFWTYRKKSNISLSSNWLNNATLFWFGWWICDTININLLHYYFFFELSPVPFKINYIRIVQKYQIWPKFLDFLN